LRVRGLPFSANTEQLLVFFQGFRLAPLSPRGRVVEMLRGLGRRPTGHAFAYFEDAMEALRAKDALHGQPFSRVGVRVYRVELLEDFASRVIVTDEDTPGDILEEPLRDQVRKTMVGGKYREKDQFRKMLFRQW